MCDGNDSAFIFLKHLSGTKFTKTSIFQSFSYFSAAPVSSSGFFTKLHNKITKQAGLKFREKIKDGHRVGEYLIIRNQ